MKGLVFLVEARSLCWFPPIISLIKVLRSLDYRVVYLGVEYYKEDCELLDSLKIEYQIHPWYRITKKQFFRRILKEFEMKVPVLVRRRWLWRQIRHYSLEAGTDNFFVWSIEMMAAAYLGNRALKLGRRHIHTFLELGDENCGPVKDFDIERFYSSATIVECEENRARILKEERHLPRLPFVIPNKLYGHPRQRRLPISDQSVRAVVEGWGDRPVFLYQGSLGDDRTDVFRLLDRLASELPDAVIAVMTSHSDKANEIAKLHDNVSVVPFMAPPGHLAVTSWATVGLAAYTPGVAYGLHPLNPVHCAPNKIFEYTGFGIPILCNAIAGLTNTVGRFRCGICVEDFSQEAVGAAAKSILKDYELYSGNSKAFFGSVDVPVLVSDILSFADSGLV